jgi:hypothetical protein
VPVRFVNTTRFSSKSFPAIIYGGGGQWAPNATF